jgi:hypothetical protein
VRRERSVYLRPTHFRERTRAWLGLDPTIPVAFVEKMRAAYMELVREKWARMRFTFAFGMVYVDESGEFRDDELRHWRDPRDGRGPPLAYDEVRLIIHRAGLSQKQLSERFVTIRWHLQRLMRDAQPTGNELEQIHRFYETFSATWSKRPDLRGGRRNVINLNLVMLQLILHVCGQAAYDAHEEDFPQISHENGNWSSIFEIYSNIMAANNLPVYCPVYETPMWVSTNELVFCSVHEPRVVQVVG